MLNFLSHNPVTVNKISRPRNWAQIAQLADNETQTLIQRLHDGNLDADRYFVRNGVLFYKYTSVGEGPRLLCYIYPKGTDLVL